MTFLAKWREPPPAKINDVAMYDERADAWWSDTDPMFAPLRAMTRPRLSFFERHDVKLEGKRVLDVGAGGGFLSVELAQRGAHVVALDLAARALKAACTEASKRALALSAVAASAEQVPLKDAVFDLVVCTDVLPHIVDKKLVFDELARLVKPGGQLFVATMNRTALAKFILITLGEDILGLVTRGTHDPATFITPDELAREMQTRGLTQAHVEGVGPAGINAKGFVFGKVPTQAVMYQSLFTKPCRSAGDHS
jgi:2-polyprenyl-6-hydroxyphenyl methylase / 3-demethylubiquinone-9 3-methyltransferase